MKLSTKLALAALLAVPATWLASSSLQAPNTFPREPVVILDSLFDAEPFPGVNTLIVYSDGRTILVQQAPPFITEPILTSTTVSQQAVRELVRDLIQIGVTSMQDTITAPGPSSQFTLTVLDPTTDASAHTFSWTGFDAILVNATIGSFLTEHVTGG
jgi:hypothetical protein